jgi:hypothetical protein
MRVTERLPLLNSSCLCNEIACMILRVPSAPKLVAAQHMSHTVLTLYISTSKQGYDLELLVLSQSESFATTEQCTPCGTNPTSGTMVCKRHRAHRPSVCVRRSTIRKLPSTTIVSHRNPSSHLLTEAPPLAAMRSTYSWFCQECQHLSQHTAGQTHVL